MAQSVQGASAPTIFQFRSTEVRTLVIDGEVWFVASDVAKALGYGLTTDMARNLDEDERGMQIVHTPSGDQEMIVINESGLYHAVLKSRKPEAKPFRKWVTSEVLPAIRKTGVYRAPAHKETSDLPDLFASHAAAMRFAMDYVTALERHTTDPASNAKPVWSEAEATKLADGLVHAWMLRDNRWLLAFGSDGRPQLTMIDPCSSVISPDKEADLKALIGNHVPMHLIPLVLHEAAERVRLCQSNRRAA